MIPDPLYDDYIRTLNRGPLHAIQRLLGDCVVEQKLHNESRISIHYVRRKLEEILEHGGINPPTPGNWVPLDRFPELEHIELLGEEE